MNSAATPPRGALNLLPPAVGALMQLAGLVVFLGDSTRLPDFLVAHAAGAVITTVGLVGLAHLGRGQMPAFALIHGTLSLLFPVLGPVLACGLDRLLAEAKQVGARSEHVVWDESVTHFVPSHSVDADIDLMQTPVEPTFTREHHHRPAGLNSVAHLPDRLRHMDPEVRRNAILPLARLRTDHAAPILRVAMGDPDEQVRLLAQNTLQSIRDRHDEILIGLHDAIAKDPGNPLNHLRLADSYSALADMNLDRDRESTDENRRKAAAEIEYAASLPMADNNPEISLRLLRRTLIMGRLDLAPHFVEKARVAAPDDVRLREAMVEIAYGKKDWATMVMKLHRLPPAPLSSPLFRQVKNYWLPETRGPGDDAA